MVSNPSARRWSRGTALLCLGLAVLLAGLLAAGLRLEVHAGSLTVTNTNDAGPGSLRQAVADAAPGDTVEFALTYPATITLTTGELVIAKPLNVAGPGAASSPSAATAPAACFAWMPLADRSR